MWTPEHFVRRSYTAESPDFDKIDPRQIRLIVRVGRQTVADFQAREPGILAFVSTPTEPGFRMEIVEAGGVTYRDNAQPSGGGVIQPPTDWQLRALGLTS